MESLETARLMTIGRFARLTGLTVKALRHYDEVGLLRPATVDPQTGYRSYSSSQVGQAEAIRTLRRLEVAPADIAPLASTDAPAAVRPALTAPPKRAVWRRARETAGEAGRKRMASGLRVARIVNTSTVGGALVVGGKVVLNRAPIERPSHTVRATDTLTATVNRRVRILKVLGLPFAAGASVAQVGMSPCLATPWCAAGF